MGGLSYSNQWTQKGLGEDIWGGGVLALLLLVHPEGIQVSKQPFWHHHFLPLPKGTQTPGRLVPP